MNEWIFFSWLFHQLVLDYLICTLFRSWFLPDYLSFCKQFWEKKHCQKDKFITSAFFHYLWISKIQDTLNQLGFYWENPIESLNLLICWKPLRALAQSGDCHSSSRPQWWGSPWLPRTNHQVFFNLFIDTWYFIFPILQRQAGFTVLLAPGTEEWTVQFSVSHHEGAKAFTGKILEEMCVHCVGLGWIRAELREW